MLPIKIGHGGMTGRIGRIVWYCGSDMLKNTRENVVKTGGFNSYGEIHFASWKTIEVLEKGGWI